MSDPSVNLQKAVYAALTQHSGLIARLGAMPSTRVYDRVPPNAVFPYVTIGDDQHLAEYDSGPFTESYVTVHVYSRAVGRIEAKTLVGLVRETLDVQLAVEGFLTMEWGYLRTDLIGDPAEHTHHYVVEFRYLLQPDA